MVPINFPQGSQDWLTARLWRLTASAMTANITSTGKLSKSAAALKSIDKMIAGIKLAEELSTQHEAVAEMDDWQLKKLMCNYTGEKFSGSVHTERGHEFESEALAALSNLIGQQISDVGMCVMGDAENGVVSCSPDGRILDSNGVMIAGAEVKAPCLCNYYKIVSDGVLPAAYKMQVHASMAICEVDTWHFGAYFKGEPLFYKEVKRETFTDTLKESLDSFADQYAERFAEVTASVEALKARGEAA